MFLATQPQPSLISLLFISIFYFLKNVLEHDNVRTDYYSINQYNAVVMQEMYFVLSPVRQKKRRILPLSGKSCRAKEGVRAQEP